MKKIIPFLFVLLWSTGFIGAKFGLPYASTGDFLFIRTIGNIIVFLCLMQFIRHKSLSRLQIAHAMVTGLLIHGAYLGGVFGAIEFGVPAGLTAIIVGLQPLFTGLLSIFLFKSRLTSWQWGALVLGFVGLILVVHSGLEIKSVSLVAIGYAFIALFGITIGTLYQKRYCHSQALLPSVCWQYVASLFVFLPLALFDGGQEVQWQLPFILSLAWLIFGLSVSAILLLMYMVKHGDSAKVTAYFYLVPPVTAIQAWLFFDEQLSLISTLGMFLCVLSVYFVNKASLERMRK